MNEVDTSMMCQTKAHETKGKREREKKQA